MKLNANSEKRDEIFEKQFYRLLLSLTVDAKIQVHSRIILKTTIFITFTGIVVHNETITKYNRYSLICAKYNVYYLIYVQINRN